MSETTVPKLSIQAAMARAGLAPTQRAVWYDDDDRRHDPLADRDNVVSLLAQLDAICAAPTEEPQPFDPRHSADH